MDFAGYLESWNPFKTEAEAARRGRGDSASIPRNVRAHESSERFRSECVFARSCTLASAAVLYHQRIEARPASKASPASP